MCMYTQISLARVRNRTKEARKGNEDRDRIKKLMIYSSQVRIKVGKGKETKQRRKKETKGSMKCNVKQTKRAGSVELRCRRALRMSDRWPTSLSCNKLGKVRFFPFFLGVSSSMHQRQRVAATDPLFRGVGASTRAGQHATCKGEGRALCSSLNLRFRSWEVR